MEKIQIEYESIGIIRTPHTHSQGSPIQPTQARGIKGRAEIDPRLQDGLKDLQGFSHVILLFHFHKAKQCKLLVTPFLDDKPHGVFETRAPARPNPIGLSVVRLEKIEGNILHLLDVDMLDGTPLLDIKPLVPKFDHAAQTVRLGWLEKRIDNSAERKGDNRFTED